jgi:hypothetical protein
LRLVAVLATLVLLICANVSTVSICPGCRIARGAGALASWGWPRQVREARNIPFAVQWGGFRPHLGVSLGDVWKVGSPARGTTEIKGLPCPDLRDEATCHALGRHAVITPPDLVGQGLWLTLHSNQSVAIWHIAAF